MSTEKQSPPDILDQLSAKTRTWFVRWNEHWGVSHQITDVMPTSEHFNKSTDMKLTDADTTALISALRVAIEQRDRHISTIYTNKDEIKFDNDAEIKRILLGEK